MALSDHLLRHTITVQPYLGTGPSGATYGAAVTYRGYVQDKRQLVRNTAGEEVTSETTVYLNPGATIPPRSKVTVPSGRTTTVITANRREGATGPVRDHLEVTLT
ncbi:hypothetical protein [Streptosporangium sp. KLBMP 9127]|nr:hypothetical protein [Streptosporangium sp. KLBMP 9127]